MNKRTWLAGLLGTVAMFLWLFVGHYVFHLGEAGLQPIDNEAPLLAAMQNAIPNHGTYIFPKLDTKGDQAANMKKMETGPSGFLVYFPTRHFNFGQVLFHEFVMEFVLVMIALYLLTLTRITTFAGRLGFFALIGLCVGSASNIAYWNWYGFDATYALSASFVTWMGYVCAGLMAGAMKIGGVRAQ